MRLAMIAVALTACPAFADAPRSFEVVTVKRLAYAPKADDRQFLDLYLPKGEEKFPVLVFLHGGGYQKGDRKEIERLGRAFAQRGVAVVAVGYRLYPQVKHPGHVEDAAKAFAWVKANIAKHGGDPAAVFVGGHSAGGHLAALLAANPRYLEAEKLGLKDIKGVFALSGGYRILPIRKEVFGGEEEMRLASPFAHLSAKAGHPPFLIVYGDKDTAGREKLSIEFRDALRKAGAEAECLEVKGRTHKELLEKVGDKDPATEAALEFIGRLTRSRR